jgi:hypothetical protein
MPSKANAPWKRKHRGASARPDNSKKRKRGDDEDFDKLVQSVEELVSLPR